jgi:hypothetical protein
MLVDLVVERLGPLEQPTSPDVILRARFIVGAFLGILLNWVAEPDAATPEQVDFTFRTMMMNGLKSWAT